MKRILFILTLIILTFFKSYGSHIKGGEITFKHVSNDDYEITLKIYRDPQGIPVTIPQNVTFESTTCNQNFTIPFPYKSHNYLSQLCPSEPSYMKTQEYIFVDTVTLSPCSDWKIHANIGSRNASITNLNGTGGFNLFIIATMNNIDGVHNNSPQYSFHPMPYICAGQLFTYSHGGYDIDGDSLHYQFTQALTNPGPPGTPIAFTGAHSITNPILTTSGMNLNPSTGEMSFTPTVGSFQSCAVPILISEYRNNQLIGTYTREMQVFVVNTCVNEPPNINGVIITNSGISGTQLDSNSFSMNNNDSLCFEISFTDVNNDSIQITSNVSTNIPGASFSVSNNNSLNPTGIFCWKPNSSISGINIFTIEAQDNSCPNLASQYFSFDITVDFLTIIENIEEKLKVKIFPNPASSELTIYSEYKPLAVIITDLSGKEIMGIEKNAKTVKIADLPSGIYFIKLITKEKTITKKFIKQ